jgi:hypothetical protein
MLDLFTIEEINLMCIFDTSGRQRLIDGIVSAMADFYDGELIEIAENALTKLNKLDDAEFDALDFYPEYGDEMEVNH